MTVHTLLPVNAIVAREDIREVLGEESNMQHIFTVHRGRYVLIPDKPTVDMHGGDHYQTMLLLLMLMMIESMINQCKMVLWCVCVFVCVCGCAVCDPCTNKYTRAFHKHQQTLTINP